MIQFELKRYLHDTLRSHQESTLNQLRASSSPYIVAEMATGAGKSFFPAQLAYEGTKTLTLVRTKSLQAQYAGPPYEASVVTGKGNYRCNYGLVPDASLCKMSTRERKECGCYAECPYYVACNRFISSHLGSLNYSKYLLETRQNGLVPAFNPQVLFLDEAHQLSDMVIDWSGCTLPWTPFLTQFTQPLELNPKLPSVMRINKAVDWLDDLLAELMRREPGKITRKSTQEQIKYYKRWENLVRKVGNTIDLVDQGREYWFAESNAEKGFRLKPLTARFHFRHLFRAPKVVLMSATVGNPAPFMAELGIYEQFESIIVPNIWPPHTRPVVDLKGPKMSYKNTEQELQYHAEVIGKALDECPGEWTGIIHTNSKAKAYKLRDRLHKLVSRPLWTPPQDTMMGTEQLLSSWLTFRQRNRGAIAISWCMWEGVDLGEDKICIVAWCLTPDMQLFGPDGYISMDSAKVGDKIFSITNKGEFIVDTIQDVIRQDWKGKIYNYKSQSYDLSVTEDHEMLYQGNYKSPEWKFQKLAARDIKHKAYLIPIAPKEWNGRELSESFSFEQYFDDETVIWIKSEPQYKYKRTLPNCFKYNGNSGMHRCNWQDLKELDWRPPIDSTCFFGHRLGTSSLVPYYWNTTDLLELIGWFVSEGNSFSQRSERRQGITITQSQKKYLSEIVDLFDRIGLPFCVHPKTDGVSIVTMTCRIVYRAMVDWCGIGAKNKKLPSFLLDSTREQIRITFESMMKGDGTIKESSWVYTTISSKLRDDFVEMALKLGYSPRIAIIDRPNRQRKYNISIGRVKNRGTVRHKGDLVISDYEGEVWCVRTTSGNILAYRNGKFVFTGNCPWSDFGDSYEKERFDFDPKAALGRVANSLVQGLGRTRRGRPQDYEPGSHFVGIADANWTRVKSFMNPSIVESIG